MKFGLSVPFRTLLNAESEQLSIHRVEAARQLEKAFQPVSESSDVVEVEVLEPSVDDTKRGLKTLSDDSVPWFCRSLAKVTLSSAYFDKAKHALSEIYDGPEWKAAIAGLELTGFVECFDNTLAVGSFEGQIDLSEIPQSVSATAFERFLSDLAERAVEPFNNDILAGPLEALSKGHIGAKHSFTRPKQAYEIFSDLNEHAYPGWNDSIPAFFWAHRVYVLDDAIRQSPEAAQLLRLDDINAFGTRVKDDCTLHVGSSVVGEAGMVAEFLRSCAISQYFYCLFDILNSNQNRLYREIASKPSMKLMKRSIRKYNRMENFIDYTGNELSNAEISFQGTRRVLFDGLNRVFGTRQLIEAVCKRDELVQSRLQRRSFLLQRADRRTLQLVIFLLGAAQLLSLVVDLFDFSGESRTFQVPGAYDLFRWMDFNITMHVAIVLVLAGAFYATIKRE
ncbi:hypothetical protein WNY37_02335 [Henriciella sp. AS95]|uniref:hypothetical protein n=1 Tax=Henriciella sp. AS95 TaxID=3135782 RepID=UPI00316EEC0C